MTETEHAVPTDPNPRRPRRRRRLVVAGLVTGALVLGGSGTAVAAHAVSASHAAAAYAGPGYGRPFGSGGGSAYGSDPFGGSAGSGSSGYGSGTGSSTSTGSGTSATAAQTAGVVTIDTVLKYQSAEAAGTGIVLTSSGRILTNNHVVSGATSITVTDESTGRSYSADVVGTDATDDIAVLQLEDASGLTVADLADQDAAVGDAVTAVGNAGGTGDLTTASGTITSTGETITTSSEEGTEGETLHGLLETDADIVSGDSGGPLTNADGEVVGIDTAASSGTADVTGYAIPIDTALSIAQDIVAGDDTDDITIGYPAFLGVEIASGTSADGAVVGGVLDGTPAETAGLEAGDVITAVDGTAVDSADALTAALAEHAPGDRVVLSVTGSDGTSGSVSVTLTEGPAD